MRPSSPQKYSGNIITESKGVALSVSLVKPVAYLSESYNNQPSEYKKICIEAVEKIPPYLIKEQVVDMPFGKSDKL